MHPRVLRTVYLGKTNFGRMSFFPGRSPILIFDDSAEEKPSQRPRSGLSLARVLVLLFCQYYYYVFRGTRVLLRKITYIVDKLHRTTGP